MEYALLQAPYRTFLSSTSKTSSKTLIIYNLPTSLTEYLSEASQTEANFVRSKLFLSSNSTNNNHIVVTYDSNAGSFLGIPGDATEADLESYVSSNNVAFTASLVGATLAALTTLDTAAASQLLPEKAQCDTVVLLGSGGREHALSVALAKSPLVGKIICLPGNGGTSAQGGKIVNATQEDGVTPLTKSDNATVVELVKRVGADMVVVGPEQPLVDGVVNELAKECPGVNCFGPSMAGAELEASKVRY